MGKKKAAVKAPEGLEAEYKDTEKYRRQLVRDMLREEIGLSSKEVAERLAKLGFEEDPSSSAFQVFVSNQRGAVKKEMGIATETGTKSVKKPGNPQVNFDLARSLSDAAGSPEKALAILGLVKGQDGLQSAITSLEKWKELVSVVGSESKAVAVAGLLF